MATAITIQGIDQALSGLQYKNKSALKYRLIYRIRQFYQDDKSIATLQEIDGNVLIKELWTTGDDHTAVKNRRKNLNSIKSTINLDLKKLYQEGENPEGIMLGPANIFVMSDEAKEAVFESFRAGMEKTGAVDLSKILDVLNIVGDALSNADHLLAQGDANTETKLEELKKLIQGLAGKVHLESASLENKSGKSDPQVVEAARTVTKADLQQKEKEEEPKGSGTDDGVFQKIVPPERLFGPAPEPLFEIADDPMMNTQTFAETLWDNPVESAEAVLDLESFDEEAESEWAEAESDADDTDAVVLDQQDDVEEEIEDFTEVDSSEVKVEMDDLDSKATDVILEESFGEMNDALDQEIEWVEAESDADTTDQAEDDDGEIDDFTESDSREEDIEAGEPVFIDEDRVPEETTFDTEEFLVSDEIEIASQAADGEIETTDEMLDEEDVDFTEDEAAEDIAEFESEEQDAPIALRDDLSGLDGSVPEKDLSENEELLSAEAMELAEQPEWIPLEEESSAAAVDTSELSAESVEAEEVDLEPAVLPETETVMEELDEEPEPSSDIEPLDLSDPEAVEIMTGPADEASDESDPDEMEDADFSSEEGEPEDQVSGCLQAAKVLSAEAGMDTDPEQSLAGEAFEEVFEDSVPEALETEILEDLDYGDISAAGDDETLLPEEVLENEYSEDQLDQMFESVMTSDENIIEDEASEEDDDLVEVAAEEELENVEILQDPIDDENLPIDNLADEAAWANSAEEAPIENADEAIIADKDLEDVDAVEWSDAESDLVDAPDVSETSASLSDLPEGFKNTGDLTAPSTLPEGLLGVDDLRNLTHQADPEKSRYLSEEFNNSLAAMDKFYNQYLFIPKAKYPVGSKVPGRDLVQEREVELAAFYIGKFPITNALFEIFIEKTGYKTTAERRGVGLVYSPRCRKTVDEQSGLNTYTYHSALLSEVVHGACWYQPLGPGSTLHRKRNHPVVQVSLEDTLAFAAWTGKRIPFEEEWEAAARGEKGYIYPWGSRFLKKACNFEESDIGDTTSVEQYLEFANHSGLVDMIGNVLEWTLSPAETGPDPEKENRYFIVKGGSWISKRGVRLTERQKIRQKESSNILGFRCVAY